MISRDALIHTLTRWPFLTALAVLLVNDSFLKASLPGLVTGKLSDFAGIAMIALPLFVAFPRRKDLEAIEPLVDPRKLGWQERTAPAPQ